VEVTLRAVRICTVSSRFLEMILPPAHPLYEALIGWRVPAPTDMLVRVQMLGPWKTRLQVTYHLTGPAVDARRLAGFCSAIIISFDASPAPSHGNINALL